MPVRACEASLHAAGGADALPLLSWRLAPHDAPLAHSRLHPWACRQPPFTLQISIVVGSAVPWQREHHAWSEGLAVLGTAFIVVFLAAGQDYSKELQFQKLNALKDVIEVKVMRNGKTVSSSGSGSGSSAGGGRWR